MFPHALPAGRRARARARVSGHAAQLPGGAAGGGAPPQEAPRKAVLSTVPTLAAKLSVTFKTSLFQLASGPGLGSRARFKEATPSPCIPGTQFPASARHSAPRQPLGRLCGPRACAEGRLAPQHHCLPPEGSTTTQTCSCLPAGCQAGSHPIGGGGKAVSGAGLTHSPHCPLESEAAASLILESRQAPVL